MHMTLIIKKMNKFDIEVPCINIASSVVLFEQYILALNRGNMTLGFEMMTQ